ncbi:unnamed protein product [Dibothriocephalus latus]|uniref:Uncharacterized protein n=1 Tax=Dibothriocephalus latus TaxID=60516 RepID=A0A3P7LIT5_DIBLA|nr:unnamed protein product [Dibothriocephalus latus]
MRPHQSNYEAAEKNLRNAGFCAVDPAGPQCPPQGLFSIASCKAPGAVKPPLFASLPHFLYADRSLRLALDGLRPDNPHRDGIPLPTDTCSGHTIIPVDVLCEVECCQLTGYLGHRSRLTVSCRVEWSGCLWAESQTQWPLLNVTFMTLPVGSLPSEACVATPVECWSRQPLVPSPISGLLDIVFTPVPVVGVVREWVSRESLHCLNSLKLVVDIVETYGRTVMCEVADEWPRSQKPMFFSNPLVV